MTPEFLQLKGWPKLKSLPDEIQHFTALKELWIIGFDGIEALPEWLGNFSSLQDLYLDQCNNLMYLPTAQTVQSLTRLEELIILDCSKLNETCAKESGVEWLKIAHIPKIRIEAAEFSASPVSENGPTLAVFQLYRNNVVIQWLLCNGGRN